jgi:hypothetical protein
MNYRFIVEWTNWKVTWEITSKDTVNIMLTTPYDGSFIVI